MHSHVIYIYTRVAAAAEKVVYEVVAEPHESQGQALQQEDREESAQGPIHPSTRHLYTFLLLVHYVSGDDWNPSCMIFRFLELY